MNGDPSQRENPLPPARTRWPEPPASPPARAAGSFFAPVRSGMPGSEPVEPVPDRPEPEPIEPQAEIEAPSPVWEIFSPIRSDDEGDEAEAADDAFPTTAAEEEAAEPWDMTEAALDAPDTVEPWEEETTAFSQVSFEDEDEAAPIEFVLESGDSGLTLAFDGDEALTLDETAFADVESVEDETVSLPEPEGETDVSPAPLSAWGLGTSARPSDAELAEKARREWESLGASLVESVRIETPAEIPGAAVEGLEPVGAFGGESTPPRPVPTDSTTAQAVPRELEELAHRLEQFAAALRSDGTRAMAVAQSRGDPVDAFLAGLAAGYLGGRRE